MFYLFGISFGLTFVIAFALIPLVRFLALRANFVDSPGEGKIHEQPVAYGGGIAVGVSSMAVVLILMQIAYFVACGKMDGIVPEGAAAFAGGAVSRMNILIPFMTLCAFVLLCGLIDDKIALKPGEKLGLQSVAAVLFTIFVDRITLFVEPTGIMSAFSYAITVLWILLITNAFNLLDHLDAICAGVSLVVCVTLFTIALLTGQIFLAALTAPLAGAILAFIPWNVTPAKMFLGDAGSQFIGFYLAGVSVLFKFYEQGREVHAIVAPLVLFAVPVFDTMVVVIWRKLIGKPVFSRDLNHIAHRLVGMGLSKQQTALIVFGIALCCGISAVLLFFVSWHGAILIFAEVLIMLLIILMIQIGGKNG